MHVHFGFHLLTCIGGPRSPENILFLTGSPIQLQGDAELIFHIHW